MTTIDLSARTHAEASAESALTLGAAALATMQHRDGWWKGTLDSNVTMDAEDLLLRQFLGVLTEGDLAATAAWIRSQQRDDGTWATFFGGPGDLSTTVEAYVALRLAGDATDAAHMCRARDFITSRGGIESTRVFTRVWLALFGEWPWSKLPALPPEVILLPRWLPLNIYDFACWARQTIVPLTVVASYRPVRPLPFHLDELRTGVEPSPRYRARSWEAQLVRLDRVLRRYERRPLRAARRTALHRAERWIVDRQEADGSWGGIQPPWVYSLLALHLRGYPLDHPVMRAGLAGLDRFTVRDGATRHLEACQSPVWDTAFAMLALSDAGLPEHQPAVTSAARWLLSQEVRTTGDWAVRRRRLAPGGWAFEFENDNYPDVDDTAEVVLALQRVPAPGPGDDGPARALHRDIDGAIRRAVTWVLGMQSRAGGWAAFDVDNTRALCTKLPFCDFGAVIDPPSADVTAHVVEMLAALGMDGRPLRRGVKWLWNAQEADGSWFGRWGSNHVYGTAHVVTALLAAGVPPTDPRLRCALRWLREHQHVDGGWGEDPRSYRDPRWVGRGKSTPSQTAWALVALLAADERHDSANVAAIEHAVGFLIDTQRADGTWDEPWYTGTGFPGDFYLNYHLYRQVFPLMALGRYVGRRHA
jgi:squalene-hopene/tetraprenyl-beta-curcumene cyclase